MHRRTTHTVRGAALLALAYPTRIEILESLVLHQPATVEELGLALGRAPKSLYHHLKPLVAVGLIVEAGERPTSKRPAKVYRLPADQLRVDPEDRRPEAMEARAKISRIALRSALKWQLAALEDPNVVFGGRHATVLLGQRIVRLRPRGRERLLKKLAELFETLADEHDESGVPFALTAHLAPVGEKR